MNSDVCVVGGTTIIIPELYYVSAYMHIYLIYHISIFSNFFCYHFRCYQTADFRWGSLTFDVSLGR